MLTGMTDEDWSIVLEVFDAVQTRSGEPGHDDRKFLEALHYFTVHTVTWRALPREFGNWISVWKRFWRLSRTGVFEAFFQILAETSKTAHMVQMSTAPSSSPCLGRRRKTSSGSRCAVKRPPKVTLPSSATSDRQRAAAARSRPMSLGMPGWWQFCPARSDGWCRQSRTKASTS